MPIVEDVDKQGFAKIITVNDWEHERHYLRAVKSNSGTWGHNDQDEAQLLKHGDKLIVKLASGRKIKGTVRIDMADAYYSEQGQPNPIRTTTQKITILLTTGTAAGTSIGPLGIRVKRAS